MYVYNTVYSHPPPPPGRDTKISTEKVKYVRIILAELGELVTYVFWGAGDVQLDLRNAHRFTVTLCTLGAANDAGILALGLLTEWGDCTNRQAVAFLGGGSCACQRKNTVSISM
jgi:hypothetical protein